MPYGSTTATFIGSKKFHDISAERLQPGDIGLKVGLVKLAEQTM